jgi:acetate kinase
MPDTILVANAGSSSIKFQLFNVVGAAGGDTGSLDLDLKGQVEGIGSHPRLIARNARGEVVTDESFAAADLPDAQAALRQLGSWLRARHGGAFPVAVGHRVVHGGPTYDTHVAIDDDVLARLEDLTPLAPLHQPNNLLPIRAIRATQPDVLQVACFDTAFHRGHPEVADRYAIPEALYRDGVRRYGFHGLSYEYIARALPAVAPEIADGRLVLAHLGSGASMCAIRGGRSLDSTMGFTALDGLPMGTRPGQLDAGVILHLLTSKGMTADAIQHLLYHDCGLKGLSGISNDVRDLLASDDPRAMLALDYFIYRSSLAIGSLAAALEGLDALVFTAGIGENAPAIRARICRKARWLGIELDEVANAAAPAAGARLISTGASRVRVYVISTDEERMIAHHTLEILGRQRRR